MVFKLEHGNILRLPDWRYEDWWLRDLKLFQRRVAKSTLNNDVNGNSTNDSSIISTNNLGSFSSNLSSNGGLDDTLDVLSDADRHKARVLETLRIAEEVELCCTSVEV